MDAGFPEKITIRQKVRAPTEPIRHERAIAKPKRLPTRVLSLTPIRRFGRSDTGNFHPPPWFQGDAADALISCRNVQIRGDGVARIVRLVVAIGHDDRVVGNFLVRHLLQQMMNAIQSRPLLVDPFHYPPA